LIIDKDIQLNIIHIEREDQKLDEEIQKETKMDEISQLESTPADIEDSMD
jgi:hypothetical protein